MTVGEESECRVTTGPIASLSSKNVPGRTPNARAILMIDAREGIRLSSKIRFTYSTVKPVPAAKSSADIFLSAHKFLIFSVTAIIVCLDLRCKNKEIEAIGQILFKNDVF